MSSEPRSETPKNTFKVNIANKSEDFVTIGYKDGEPVIKPITLEDKEGLRDLVKMSTDKMPTPTDSKPTDSASKPKLVPLSKAQIVVRVDPQTGKRYMHKDGQRYEILGPSGPGPQALNLTKSKCPDRQVKVIVKAPQYAEPQMADPVVMKWDKLIVVKPSVTSPVRTYGGKKPPPLTPISTNQPTLVHASCQTDTRGEMCDSSTQTDVPYPTGDSQCMHSLFHFILSGDEDEEIINAPISNSAPAVVPAVTSVMRSKEEMAKFEFFNDMRTALQENSGNLPIHEGVMQNNPQAVRRNCIILRARKVSIDVRNHQSYSPLHLAMLCDASVETVNILLQYGAELEESNFNDGNTALHYAVEYKRLTLLRTLLAHARRNHISLDIFNFDGLTPLMMSCCSPKSIEFAKMLLEMGADPNVRDRKSGRTALFHAAECHADAIVELLIEFKADTKLRNFFGTSPHDAMFELDNMPNKIKSLILGKDRVKSGNKLPMKRAATSNNDSPSPPAQASTSTQQRPPFKRIAPHPPMVVPKYKMDVRPTLKKVCASDLRTVSALVPVKKK